MQSNIFVQVAPLLKEKKFNIDCDAVVEFLDLHYSSGKWIYPDVLHRNLKISIVDTYKVMNVFEELGLVEQYLAMYCPSCKKFTGIYYKSLFDIPEEVYCPHCDNEVIKPTEHAIIIYKVK